MSDVSTLGYALDELRKAVVALDDSHMEMVTNCAPWTVRQLASHALNNQLLWGGIVTGQDLVSADDTMSAVAYDGDLAAFAEEATRRALAMWSTDGVLEAMHATPMGELPGSTVIDFAIVDAVAHSWDLSASVGRPLELAPGEIPAIAAVVEATCTDAARQHGLIQPVTTLPDDATDTERLMAAAGRSVPR